jgi:hypothetical protein
MCSIGWLRLKDTWYFFKNRDLTPGDPLTKTNIFFQDNDVAGLANKKFTGMSTGLNKYGIAIMANAGPENIAPLGKLTTSRVIGEKVLRSCKTLKSAKEKYKELAKDLGYNYNVIIADSKHAYSLEITADGVKEERSDKYIARTNHFVNLTKYNDKHEFTVRSKLRFKKIIALIKKARSSEDMIAVLKFHSSNNDMENVCNHAQGKQIWSQTCASVLFEVKGKKVTAYYVLNKYPCKARYIKKQVKFKVK